MNVPPSAPDRAYAWLIAGVRVDACDPFDVHVLASVLALAISETAANGVTLSDGTGLTPSALATLLAAVFPHAHVLLREQHPAGDPVLGEEEASLRALLERFATAHTPLERDLAAMIARRAMHPNHLWQDLGLGNRGQLGKLLHRHFARLAQRNVDDMKWKKFFYRAICRDEGFRLCTAPSCAQCGDFAGCFGDETGESLLARTRRDFDRTMAAVIEGSSASPISQPALSLAPPMARAPGIDPC